MTDHALFIGIDLGTSGVRACAIDQNEKLLHLCSTSLPGPVKNKQSITQDPVLWWQATEQVLKQLFAQIDPSEVVAISVNGTSGTILLCDDNGLPVANALMYNDASCSEQAELIKAIAPNTSGAHGSSSGLAKLLYLQKNHPRATRLLHQADWVAGQLCGRFDITDENNALKTGYDPQSAKWPDWLQQLKLNTSLLPGVVAPGSVIGSLKPGLFSRYELNPNCLLVSGTTDSIAAFLATGANKPGDAVTSLGSTLVLKVVSSQPVSNPELGIYSHKLGDYWLAGGASNSGGAVLKHYFNQQQLDELTPLVNPEKITGLNYYPLLQVGERFPINDPTLKPRLEPKADNDVEFFQAILEGIGQIEQDGYNKLQQLGAPYPTQVETAGGGSKNLNWNLIRQQLLGVPVHSAQFSEACYGSALLAKRGFKDSL